MTAAVLKYDYLQEPKIILKKVVKKLYTHQSMAWASGQMKFILCS